MNISKIYTDVEISDTKFPIFSSKIRAGFPSPAEDHVESRLDLSALLTPNPTSTYFVRVEGDSMIDAGIFHDDILVVDRSISAVDGRIAIVAVDNELTVKRIIKNNDGSYTLHAENPVYNDIVIKEGQELQTFGVVTGSARTNL